MGRALSLPANISRETLILLEKDGLVVANKPPHLPSTGRDLADPRCLQAVLVDLLGRRKLWAVHQLDQDTSGLNLFVLQRALVESWGALLRAPESRKTYLAIVHGRWRGGGRRIEVPVGFRVEGGRRFPAVSAQGRPARSRVQPLAVGEAHSLLAVVLETGRTHQARLHLSHVGHPLLGERLHRQPACTALDRHALHAWKLKMPQAPVGLQDLRAPLPEDLREAAARLGLGLPQGEG